MSETALTVDRLLALRWPSRARVVLLAALATMLLAVAGCGSIPDDGPPVPVNTKMPDSTVEHT